MRIRGALALFSTVLGVVIFSSACQKQAGAPAPTGPNPIEDDFEELTGDKWSKPLSCTKANSTQIGTLNKGGALLDRFLKDCHKATVGSPWCEQLTRPNPESRSIFSCTYGEAQPHLMIHPDEDTWQYAFDAVQLVKELERKGIKVCLIYNWWRAEPYNANVGGAAGRHPHGTSVDVRMCSLPDMEKAFLQLCEWRDEGRLRAVGYYGSTGLHFGIGDAVANTWGKDCP